MPAITVSTEIQSQTQTHAFQYTSTSTSSSSPLPLTRTTSLSTSYHPERVQLNHKWDNGYNLWMEQFLRYMPKVELHVHLDGSMDPLFLWDYLKSSGSGSSGSDGNCSNCSGMECLPEEVTLPWNNQTLKVRSAVEACTTLEEFTTLITCRGERSLFAMLECFEIFVPIVRGNLVLLEQLAFDFCQRQFSQRVMYTEVRYSPHFLVAEKDGSDGDEGGGGDSSGDSDNDDDGNSDSNGNSDGGGTMKKRKGTGTGARDVIDAITRGLRRGEKEYGIKVNQILCCIAWRPDWAREVVELARDYKDNYPCAVVGVDIAAGEDHFDQEKLPHLYEPHYEAFQIAQEYDLNITIHAGEVGDSQFVRKAVNEYGARRIGHGYKIACEPDVMEEMRRKNIHFEVCPTSSNETGGWAYDGDGRDDSDNSDECGKEWKKHPAIDMIRYGLNVGINSDDPAVFDTSLTWQYRIGVGKMGMSKDAIITCLQNSISSAFVEEDVKVWMRNRVDIFLEEHDECMNET